MGYPYMGGFGGEGEGSGYNPLPASHPGGMPTNTNSDTYAQDTNAWITRSQWADYKDRFMPVEDQLIDETMGMDLLNERLGAISAVSDTTFDTNMLAAEQRRARYGVELDKQGRASQQRSRELAQSTSVADGKNNTRTHIYDRNMDTISGGSSAVNQAIRG
jgi:hypothetical protein